MRISDWVKKFNITVKRCEERPDAPQGEIVYRVKEIFTTLLGSWEPSDGYGSLPQWARDAYLKPWGAEDYFDDAGADHGLFALVLDLDGKPVKTENLVRFWSDGFAKLGDPNYVDYARATPKPGSGWAKNDIWNYFSPEAGEQGAWCWCPEGAADVVVGGGMPNRHHVSTFVVWQAEHREDTGGVDEEPTKPDVSFVVTLESVIAGQAVTLKWDVAGARALTLEGPGLTGQGSFIVTSGQAGRYTLAATMMDGSKREAQVTVVAPGTSPDIPPIIDPTQPSKPQPQVTRPPTVILSAANIAHLRTFPRPANDNGIGLHFHLDTRDEIVARTVEQLKSIRATWTRIYAQDEQQARRAAEPCWRAGIMPVVRIGKYVDDAFDPVPYVHALKAIQAPPYVQIFNEPDNFREWRKQEPPEGWEQIFASNWAGHAARVFDAGGYPGLQVLNKSEFDAAVDAVKAIQREDIWERAFFVQHNYGVNHPPAFPYDARNQHDNPGQTILQDTMGVLSFLAYAAWMQERLGFVLPIIGGEGGWLFGAEEDKRYPKVERALHAQYHKEMFEWLRTGVLANGEPLPDYLFSITPWIAGSWDFIGQNWWGNAVVPEGKLTETIEAVQSIPPFVRKFSWDA